MKKIKPAVSASLALRIMKLSVFTLAVICCSALVVLADPYAKAQTVLDKKISINLNHKVLKEVLNELTKSTGVRFAYSNEIARSQIEITSRTKGKTLKYFLQEVLRPYGCVYDVLDHEVIIRFDPSKTGKGVSPQERQVLTVSGIISDKTGPLPGVSILVKGSQNSTSTNGDGKYTLKNVPEDAILVFKSVGYKSVELAVNGRSSINVVMESEITNLSEVVVIGYGVKKKEFLSGAVSTVSAEVIESKPVTNALSALQGEVPGFTIERSSGQPGTEGYGLKVRGLSSTNYTNPTDPANPGRADSSPFILVDGVPGDINSLNPSDIESVTVLKDAQAAIYGARAANGVILVTTKKGLKGTPKISYNSNFAISKMMGMMESPTNYEMAIMDNEANIHNNAAPMYTPDYLSRILNNDPTPIPHPIYGGWMLFFTNTDWKKELLENGFQQKHNLNISGGGNNSTYFLSGGYSDQKGVIRYANDNNKRYNLRLNYDYDISKHIRLETKVSLENQKRSDLGGIGSWVITEGIFGMPNHPVYSSDGKFFAQGGWGNAVAQAKEAATSTFNTRNLNSNFKLIADLTGGLKLNLQAGLNYVSRNNEDIAKSVSLYNWAGEFAYYTIANPEQASLTEYNSEDKYQNYTAYLQYNKTFANKHSLDLMAGGSREENKHSWFNAGRDHFITDDLWSLNLGGTSNMSNNGGSEHWAIGSVFSRLSYVYDNKYILEANLRYDGSSRFESRTRWGLFPGVSAAWRISQENFLKDNKIINDLKLRASYGQTGNQEGIKLYDYIQLLKMRELYYPFGAGEKAQAAYLDGMVSVNRTWETLVNRNLGLDASLLNSKLNFSFDYFIKTNKNLLIPITYPSILGSEAPFSNSGKLKTWGFETSISYNDKVGNVAYSAKLMLSDAQTKLVNYGGGDTYKLGLNYIREGYPVNTYFAYEFDGLIRTQQELDAYKKLGGVPSDIGIGDARFKDINGDGKISPYGDNPGEDGDVINAGTTTPRYNFGLNLGAKYKGFDISVFLQGTGKRTIFREGEYAMPWSDWWRQPPALYYGQTWNEDRPDATYPRLSHGNIRNWNYQASTLQKINGNYVRLKNLQVGYTLPKELTGKISVSRARIYFSGQDLWELHHVKGGWDPESSMSGFNYPFQRMYSFGLDLTF